jgi:hypothetical protein
MSRGTAFDRLIIFGQDTFVANRSRGNFPMAMDSPRGHRLRGPLPAVALEPVVPTQAILTGRGRVFLVPELQETQRERRRPVRAEPVSCLRRSGNACCRLRNAPIRENKGV